MELTASLRGQTAALQELGGARGELKKAKAQVLQLMGVARAQQEELKALRAQAAGAGGAGGASGAPRDEPQGSLGAGGGAEGGGSTE